jgi:hypothetical protein
MPFDCTPITEILTPPRADGGFREPGSSTCSAPVATSSLCGTKPSSAS